MAENDFLIVTLEEAYAYIGIDYADEMVQANITRAIKTADQFLRGSIGVNYPIDDPRAKELALIIVNDLYENRNTESNSITGNTRRLVNSMLLQLRLELRRGSNV